MRGNDKGGNNRRPREKFRGLSRSEERCGQDAHERRATPSRRKRSALTFFEALLAGSIARVAGGLLLFQKAGHGFQFVFLLARDRGLGFFLGGAGGLFGGDPFGFGALGGLAFFGGLAAGALLARAVTEARGEALAGRA